MWSVIFTILFGNFIGRLTYRKCIKERWNKYLAWLPAVFVGFIAFILALTVYQAGHAEETTFYTVAIIVFCGLLLSCLVKEKELYIKSKTNPDGQYYLIDVLGLYSSVMFAGVILYNIFGGSVPQGTTQSMAPVPVAEAPALPAPNPTINTQPENVFNNQQVEDIPDKPAKHDKKQHVEQAHLIEKPVKRKARDSCDNLPGTCGGMSSCKQAYQALACGNYRLDRDDDGVPCESICGSH